jgi:hypothetical protein
MHNRLIVPPPINISLFSFVLSKKKLTLTNDIYKKLLQTSRVTYYDSSHREESSNVNIVLSIVLMKIFLFSDQSLKSLT